MNRFIKILLVEDYHDFDIICNSFINEGLSYRELGQYPLDNQRYMGYIGVAFNGKPPEPEELTDALEKADIDLNILEE